MGDGKIREEWRVERTKVTNKFPGDEGHNLGHCGPSRQTETHTHTPATPTPGTSIYMLMKWYLKKKKKGVGEVAGFSQEHQHQIAGEAT